MPGLCGFEFEHGRPVIQILKHDLHRHVQPDAVRRDPGEARQYPRPPIYFHHRYDFNRAAVQARTKTMLPVFNKITVDLALAAASDPRQVTGGAVRTIRPRAVVKTTAGVAPG